MTDVIIPAGLRKINQERCNIWHPQDHDDWTLGDWGNALGGEIGELLNVVKKIRRHEAGAATAYNTPELTDLGDQFDNEVADCLLYLDLLCWKAGRTPEQIRTALQYKFNLVSMKNDWPHLLWDGQ